MTASSTSTLLIAVALVGLSATSSCSRRKTAVPAPAATSSAAPFTWRSDRPYLQTAMPFLGSISSCSWHSETRPQASRDFPPAPSTQLLSGYAAISPGQLQSLTAKYGGDPCSIGAVDLEVAPNAQPFTGTVLEMSKLERALPAESTFHSGQVYVLPDFNVIYFKLVKN